MAKAVLQARGKYVTAILIWRTVLATSLCLCALTALYYEASSVLIGINANEVQLVADEEFSLGMHMTRPTAVLRTPCDYGVAEKDRHTFCCAGKFDCGNSDSKQIPCWQINDDYCDCLSGRDEPGTSACSQQGANFTCSDGRQAMSTSFVQDGFRDCADGSDETPHTRGFRSHMT